MCVIQGVRVLGFVEYRLVYRYIDFLVAFLGYGWLQIAIVPREFNQLCSADNS